MRKWENILWCFSQDMQLLVDVVRNANLWNIVNYVMGSWELVLEPDHHHMY